MRKYRLRTFIISLLFLSFAGFNFLYYLNQYFMQQNYFASQDWQYGYKEAVSYVKSIEQKYDKVVISNERPLDQSYMFFLFYLQYPPEKYQQQEDHIDSLSGNFADTHRFGKYEFRPLDWEKEKRDEKTLYIGRAEDFPKHIQLKQINYLNGEPAILFVH